MRLILILTVLSFNFFYIKSTFSNEQTPVRITIYPTVIDKNVVGSSTTIINNKMIKENSHLPLGHLLSKFSGINFENLYSGVDVKSSVRIRGFGEQATRNVLILINGTRVSDMTIAGTNLSRILTEDVQEIEIIKGGTASMLFGDGATAGAINIITKDPLYLKDKFQIKNSLKSFNTNKQVISSIKKFDDFVIDYSITNLETDGYRNNSDYDQSSFGFNLTKFNDDSSRSFLEFKHTDEQNRLPGSILLTDFYTNPKYSRFPEDFGTEKITSLKIGKEKNFDNNSKFSTNLRLENKDQYSSMLSWGIRYKSKTTLNTAHLNSQYINNGSLFWTGVTPKFGIDIYNSTYKVDANNWAYTQYINKAEQRIIEPSMIFNIKDKKIKGLDYEVGLRSHHYDIEVYNHLAPKVKVLSNKEDNYAWSLGADYKIEKKHKIFGHVARSYRSPRLDEIVTVGPSTSLNPLKHQFSHDIELGYEQNSSDHRYKISTFKTLIKNQIFYNATSFANENYDPSVHEGIELEFDKKISEKIDLNSNSTFMNSYVTKGAFKGNETPYVPKWRANATLTYEIDKNSKFNYSYKYFGKTRAGNDDNYLIPKSKSYQISDIKYSYKFKNFTLNSFVNNVLDEKYYTNLILGSGNVGYVYPQAGRTIGLEIEADF